MRRAGLLLLLVVLGGARGALHGALGPLEPLLGALEDFAAAACAAAAADGAEAGGATEVVEVRRGAADAPPGEDVLPVYVPGWGNSPADEAARALLGALLTRHRAVLVLDTRAAFGRAYPAAAAAVEGVARRLAALLERLGARGVPARTVHLIGFSLGAHAAGAGARLLRRRTGARVGRLTALDPARPCFARASRRLRRSDARFVHVVHSSALGVREPLGHADVYVAARAGCGLECAHHASWRAYAASVASARALQARRCRAWPDSSAASCEGAPLALGYHVNTTLRGTFLADPPD